MNILGLRPARFTSCGLRLVLLFLLLGLGRTVPAQAILGGDAPGFTVSDVDCSVEFFQRVLSFKQISDIEVTGTEYEHLQGVFGVKLRTLRRGCNA